MRELAEVVLRIDGLTLQGRAPASTTRRPEAEAPRYQRGGETAWLETGDASKGGLGEDHSLFRGAPLGAATSVVGGKVSPMSSVRYS